MSCTNPLPAQGGVDPETNAQIQTRAPQAFLTQERAVTMQDYANVVERNPLIEDAAASLHWTGSWYTVFRHRRAGQQRPTHEVTCSAP